MKPNVIIDYVSMDSLGWLRESVYFPTPQPLTNTVVVPGRNSPIRFNEALGRVSYRPRSFDITLTMHGSRSLFNQMVSETVNRFTGHLTSVICSEEPNLYALGTLEAKPTFDPLSGKGTLVLSCTDGDAYLYHVNETVVTVTGNGTALLHNDYMPVVPVITTTEETTLSWNVGTDSFLKTVSAGTWELPELELSAEMNSVTVLGNGTTTFRYREGRL